MLDLSRHSNKKDERDTKKIVITIEDMTNIMNSTLLDFFEQTEGSHSSKMKAMYIHGGTTMALSRMMFDETDSVEVTIEEFTGLMAEMLDDVSEIVTDVDLMMGFVLWSTLIVANVTETLFDED